MVKSAATNTYIKCIYSIIHKVHYFYSSYTVLSPQAADYAYIWLTTRS